MKSKSTICPICGGRVISEPKLTDLGSFICYNLPKHESGTCILYLLNKIKDTEKLYTELKASLGGK